jgi:hypothetical protein
LFDGDLGYVSASHTRENLEDLLNGDWVEMIDPDTGSIYYENQITGMYFEYIEK